MHTVKLTRDNFESTVDKGGIVLIDFWADWCGPCKAFAPVFEKAAAIHSDIVFGKVDTDEQVELATEFHITAIPTLVALRDGIIVFAQPGLLPGPALEEVIARIRALDMNEIRRETETRATA